MTRSKPRARAKSATRPYRGCETFEVNLFFLRVKDPHGRQDLKSLDGRSLRPRGNKEKTEKPT